MHPTVSSALLTVGLLLASGCGADPAPRVGPVPLPLHRAGSPATLTGPAAPAGSGPATAAPTRVGEDVYAHTRASDLSPLVRRDPRYVYVPNGKADTVSVVDQKTYKVIRTFPVGRSPEHVVPSHDLRSLWVTSDAGNSMTRIDPATGTPTGTVAVPDPYNLYFTPDGRSAVVVAERLRRLDFRDPTTMALQTTVPVDCPGVDHADFSGDGSYLIATCEFSGRLVKIATGSRKVLSYLSLGSRSSPQDIRVGPDGHTFFVADQDLNALVILDGRTLRRIGLVPGLPGAHGIYPSRDARSFYISDRRGAAVTVLDVTSRRVRAVWPIPGGGSPDMGGVSLDGTQLWLTSRYGHEIFTFDTRTGRVTQRTAVGSGPHGACVWPQPGRYSLGHTGNMR
jgi:YVTN family beta-propeller protein